MVHETALGHLQTLTPALFVTCDRPLRIPKRRHRPHKRGGP